MFYTTRKQSIMYTGPALGKCHVSGRQEHHMLEGQRDGCTVCLNTAAGQAQQATAAAAPHPASHLPPAKYRLKQVTSVKLLMMFLMDIVHVLWLSGFRVEGKRKRL